MKYILIFIALLIASSVAQNYRISQLEEKIKIQRVEINSLVKNKAWRIHE